jgi:ABC-type transport system involved in cytochrome bd biosynthesis fused ATPase/permease subunit
MWMPMGLSAIADAASAVERLYDVFVAEVITDIRVIDPDLDVALRVSNATFIWDGAQPEEQATEKTKQPAPRKSTEDTKPQLIHPELAYKLQDMNLVIPRGQLCAIVGAIGSGKSSLLQGMIGEMRRTSGEVVFGGSVSYCPQTAWIQVRPS